MKKNRFLLLAVSFCLIFTLPGGWSLPGPARANPAVAGLKTIGDDLSVPVDASWWDAAQQALSHAEYEITWQDQTYLTDLPPAYQAPNRAHNLRAYFTPHGLRLIPRQFSAGSLPWQLGLELVSQSLADALHRLADPDLVVQSNRLEYRRGELLEWYENQVAGLAHGFTFTPGSTPSDPGLSGERMSYRIELSMHGSLVAVLAEDNRSVTLSTPDGVSVLRYGDLNARDAHGSPLPVVFELSRPAGADSTSLQLVVDLTQAAFPVMLEALLTASPWMAESDQESASFGCSVGTAGDVNGDGYTDVIVGAHNYDAGQTDEGRAYVFHGSPSGLGVAPAWTAESDQVAAHFAHQVATAGDVNNDGFADVIVGAHAYDNGQADEGRVTVFHGSAAGLSTTASWSAEGDQAFAAFGCSVSTAGDVNGDGYADVIVGACGYDNAQEDEGRAYIFYGSGSGLNATPGWTAESDQAGADFGASVATAGDVNGDGYADVLVGAPFFKNIEDHEGRAYVFHGSDVGVNPAPAWTAESNQVGAYFGNSAAAAGDVNGDGYADVIVGAYGYNNGEDDEGRVFVYHGSPSGLSASASWTVESNQAWAHFGYSVASAGDINGDGYADVIVGTPEFDQDQENEGRAYVYRGSPSGLDPAVAWSAESEQVEAGFGRSVATAGDVNGDGYSDVIIGADGFDNGQVDEGRAYVLHGGPGTLGASPSWTTEGDQAVAQYGYAVSSAGDVNGDGYADVIVGAPSYDNGQANEGRAVVFHGSANGLSATFSWSAESDQIETNFGSSVGTAGDVNGDGYADVIVGVHGFNNGQEDEGRAYVYHGSSTGLDAMYSWSAEGDQVRAFFGFSVATAGDVNGDGYADVIVGAPYYDNGQQNEGRVFIFHGSPSGLTASPVWTRESDSLNALLGWSVASAGDVNADGFADVIIGGPDYVYPGNAQGGGTVFVCKGSLSGLKQCWQMYTTSNDEHLGYSVGSAGDVDGDGYSDIIIGWPNYSASGLVQEGAVRVCGGGVSDLLCVDTWSWQVRGEQANAHLGMAVSTAGDVNGDGLADIILAGEQGTMEQETIGNIRLFLGSVVGLSTAPVWTVTSNQAGDDFGNSVATAGDINGDGYADVLVGAGSYTNDQLDEGQAYLYYGNASKGLALRPRPRRVDNSAPIAFGGRSDDPYSFRLATLARTPYGRARIKLEWEVKPLGTPFDGVLTGQSSSWLNSGTAGVAANQLVLNLSANTIYHWRIRIRYHPAVIPWQQYSRWFTQPWNGWQELDLRTNARYLYLPILVGP